MKRLKKFSHKFKSNQDSKGILHKSKLAITTFACSALLFTGLTVHASFENNFDTIYHVYVDEGRVGSIDDLTTYESLVEEKISKFEEEREGYSFVIGEEVTIIPERVFQARTSTNETLELLQEMLTVKAEAVALTVDDEAILYVKDEEEANELLEAFTLQYITEDQLAHYKKSVEEDLMEEPAIGERVIRHVAFTTPVEFTEGITEIDQVLNREQALKVLNLGVLEEKKYLVAPGDVLGSIAEKHDLKVADLLKLNPSITADSLLHIGQELSVTAYEPAVKVIVEEAVRLEEEIPFQTEMKEDSNLWKGDTKVTQEGSVGSRIASYEVVKENGQTMKREMIEETITKEPINKIIVKGTKVMPSRGTGSLSWPAVGGYISSYQGMRWGRLHKGIDIAGPSHLAILAADNGTVSFAGWDGGYGNIVRINHNNGMVTFYAHLSSIDVSVGQVVGKGQKLGNMGSTGNSTGVHLHFEVFQNGQLKNPMDYLSR